MFALEFPVVLHIFNDDAWLYRKKLFFQDWEAAQLVKFFPYNPVELSSKPYAN